MMALKGMHRPETPEEVLKRLTYVTDSGCHAWLGSHSRGYAKMRWYNDVQRLNARVVRVIYEMKRGPIPDGLEIDHVCHHRWCVNLDHLELVTHQENIRRQRAHRMATVTMCRNGHSYTVRKDGTRYCKECRSTYLAAYYQSKNETGVSNGPE